MSAWNDERRGLLQALQRIGGAGKAEGWHSDRIPLRFYPVTEHLRALDPDVVLVVGPRGAGKTEIARVLTDTDLSTSVSRYAPAVRFPEGDVRWISAYPADAHGFEIIGLRLYVESAGQTNESMRDLWFAYLVRRLAEEITPEDQPQLRGVIEPSGGDIQAITNAFKELGTRPVVALDRLDASLVRANRYLFVTYDELEKLGEGNWELIEAGVRGLVAFWAAYSRRWKRIRAKIFLRTDLYDRHARSGGADLAKLAAGRVDLLWNDRDLYGLLLKRLANLDDSLGVYIRKTTTVDWAHDPQLGEIPQLRKWQDARPVVERMVGPYMGANRKKGLVYRWILDHVKDGLGRALPRPLLGLIDEAARQELQHFGSVRSPRLLEPASLRRALDRVSNNHFAQSLDEWPWLDTVKQALGKSPLVPWDRERDLIRFLERFPGTNNAGVPPLLGRDLLDYLIEIGVLRRRADGRVDAPDLFLSGLGLRRKGGVRKRQ